MPRQDARADPSRTGVEKPLQIAGVLLQQDDPRRHVRIGTRLEVETKRASPFEAAALPSPGRLGGRQE